MQRLISEEVVEGDRLKWTVHVTGDPVPKVTWLRDGQAIPNCDEVRLVDVSTGITCFLAFFSIIDGLKKKQLYIVLFNRDGVNTPVVIYKPTTIG